MLDDNISRPIGLADFLVIGSHFINNIVSSVHAMTSELSQLAMYNANREYVLSKVWEEFSLDLEKLGEE